MGQVFEPPGFCFCPSDEELVSYYLKRKVYGWPLHPNIISEADPYKCEPWDLPGKSCLKGRDLKWHFFSPRFVKYPSGCQAVRATEAGYWKDTGKDQPVFTGSGVVGIKRTLVFYRGHAPRGERTHWRMNEYMLQDENSNSVQDSYVLCQVFQTTIPGPKVEEGDSAPTSKEDMIEGPKEEHCVMTSLDMECDSLATQCMDELNNTSKDSMLPGKDPALEDVFVLSNKMSGGSIVPDDDEFHIFLMTHIHEPNDLKQNTVELGSGPRYTYDSQDESIISNERPTCEALQPQGLNVFTELKNVAPVNERDAMEKLNEDDVGNVQLQNTILAAEDETSNFCPLLLDLHDLPPDVLEGDFLELNDLLTPL
eukprot:Gb_21446 [translate_table: standard]